MTLKVHTRADLERAGVLVPPNPAHLSVDPWGDRAGITWHWEGVFENTPKPPPALQRLTQIQRDHMEGRGYGDIAYNAAFDVDGNLYGLRDPHWTGAHASSNGNIANVTTLGICFLEDARGLTAAGLGPMELAVFFFELRYKHKPTQRGHRDWQAFGGIATTCPGDQLEAFVRFLEGLHA